MRDVRHMAGVCDLQAKVTMIVGAAMATAVGLHRDRHGSFNLKGGLLVLLAYGVVAYNSVCLVRGGCQAWSWISVLSPVLSGLLFLWIMARSQESPTSQE